MGTFETLDKNEPKDKDVDEFFRAVKNLTMLSGVPEEQASEFAGQKLQALLAELQRARVDRHLNETAARAKAARGEVTA